MTELVLDKVTLERLVELVNISDKVVTEPVFGRLKLARLEAP